MSLRPRRRRTLWWQWVCVDSWFKSSSRAALPAVWSSVFSSDAVADGGSSAALPARPPVAVAAGRVSTAAQRGGDGGKMFFFLQHVTETSQQNTNWTKATRKRREEKVSFQKEILELCLCRCRTWNRNIYFCLSDILHMSEKKKDESLFKAHTTSVTAVVLFCQSLQDECISVRRRGGSGGSGEACVLESQDDITLSLWQEMRGSSSNRKCFTWLHVLAQMLQAKYYLGFFLFLRFFFATVSLECQRDCWLLISSKTGNGFARSLLLHSRQLTTRRLFLFKWKWHESEDESVSLKNWEDSKWLEGVWHRMCREALLFLLPVSFTSSLQEW